MHGKWGYSTDQEHYDGDFAEGWPPSTTAQNEELEDALRKVLGEWLDKHDVRPAWGIVESDTIREIGHPEAEGDGCR